MSKRLPAEWENSYAVMLTWPHLQGDWSASFDDIHKCYLAIARAISPHANLIISAADEDLAETIRTDLGDIDNILIFTVPSDDTWVRDHGPITVYEDNEPVLLDFIFNGWGNKYPATNDNQITQSLYNADAFPGYDYEQIDFVLEGGSIETDGAGTLLTTSSCLLSRSRNAGMTQQAIESCLQDYLGVDRILWIEHSDLAGDDTDGHIDMLARFLDPGTIAYTACRNENDVNYTSLASMKAELEGLRDRNGNPYKLVPLIMPDPIFNRQGKQLPASYANFLILGSNVFVPSYGVEADQAAIIALQQHLHQHTVTAVPCRALIEQFGSLHCATMQLPQ